MATPFPSLLEGVTSAGVSLGGVVCSSPGVSSLGVTAMLFEDLIEGVVRLLGGVAWSLMGVVWLLVGVASLLGRCPLGKGRVCLILLDVSNHRNIISHPGSAEMRRISSGVWYRMELTSWHRVLRTESGACRSRCNMDMKTSMCEM